MVQIAVMSLCTVWDRLLLEAIQLVNKRNAANIPFSWNVIRWKNHDCTYTVNHEVRRSQCTKDFLEPVIHDLFWELWLLDDHLLDCGYRELAAKRR